MDVPFAHIPAFAPGGKAIHVVVETPRGSRHKYRFDARAGLFELGFALPIGFEFPYDFGFVPSTLAEDGDPLDVLLLMDEPTFPGCFLQARLLGVIEARQTKRGVTVRNDRLLAVARESRVHDRLRTPRDVGRRELDEIEHFFVPYNAARGKRFVPLGRGGPAAAHALVERARKRAERELDRAIRRHPGRARG